MLENKKKINLIKAPLKKKQSDIKEKGINAKKKINNIH